MVEDVIGVTLVIVGAVALGALIRDEIRQRKHDVHDGEGKGEAQNHE